MAVWRKVTIPGVDEPIYLTGVDLGFTYEGLGKYLAMTERPDGYVEGDTHVSINLVDAQMIFKGISWDTGTHDEFFLAKKVGD